MKKFLLLVGVVISIGFQAFGSKTVVYTTMHKRGEQTQRNRPHRSPMHLPIEVTYDDETRQVEIIGNEEEGASVSLCDENGNVLDYAPCINAVLNVPADYNGLLIIHIEAEDWIANGEITV